MNTTTARLVLTDLRISRAQRSAGTQGVQNTFSFGN